MLILLAGGAVAFSATEFKGARETRLFVSSVVDVVKEKGAQWLPGLRKSAQKAIDRAVASLPSVGGQTGTSPECPPGTRSVVSLPTNDPNTQVNQAEPAPDGLAQTVCVDERPVSEIEYAACAACEQPRLGGAKVKRRTMSRSEFCLAGNNATAAPILCITWKQADAYCQSRAGRLPTEIEIRAATDPTAAQAPVEWTQPAPKTTREKLSPFRCVSSKNSRETIHQATPGTARQQP
jgi:hypothetical protein